MNSRRVFRSVGIALTTFLALSCSGISDATDPLTSDTDLTGSDGGIVVTAAEAYACTESWTTPTFATSGKKVKGARWVSTRTPVELTVSGIIGSAGGSLAIPGSQFVIYFPKDAVSKPMAITITSKASSWVTYDMAPHGTIFRKPVYVLQGLENTALFGTSLAC